MPVPTVQDLVGRADLLVESARDAERLAQLVDDVLVRRRDAAADGFLAGAGGTLPVGVDVSAGQLGSRVVMTRDALGLGALAVRRQICDLARRRAEQRVIGRIGRQRGAGSLRA